jgi:hypothetical protein
LVGLALGGEGEGAESEGGEGRQVLHRWSSLPRIACRDFPAWGFGSPTTISNARAIRPWLPNFRSVSTRRSENSAGRLHRWGLRARSLVRRGFIESSRSPEPCGAA